MPEIQIENWYKQSGNHHICLEFVLLLEHFILSW